MKTIKLMLLAVAATGTVTGCAQSPLVVSPVLPGVSGTYAAMTSAAAPARQTSLSAAQVSQAITILKQDLSRVAGDAEDHLQGTPKVVATQKPQVVTITGTYFYDDLWGGKGSAGFVATVDLQKKVISKFQPQ